MSDEFSSWEAGSQKIVPNVRIHVVARGHALPTATHLSHNANSFLGTMAGTAAALVVGDQTNQESRTRTIGEAAAMAPWDQLGRKR